MAAFDSKLRLRPGSRLRRIRFHRSIRRQSAIMIHFESLGGAHAVCKYFSQGGAVSGVLKIRDKAPVTGCWGSTFEVEINIVFIKILIIII